MKSDEAKNIPFDVGNMKPIIKANNVTKVFHRRGWFPFGDRSNTVHAVNAVSFSMVEGESVGVAGESGCGKTTLGRLVAGLYRPTSGRILINGQDLTSTGKEIHRKLRRDCRMIFQSLDAALNPYLTVGQIIEEPIRIHTTLSRREREKRVFETLELVNLAASFRNEYPHTLSGGEKRRVSVARAIAVPPKILIADEPVSALDVSIRAQIVDLFQTLRTELNLTMIFISHNLGVLNDVCDRLLVMYNGSIVEDAPIENLRRRSLSHPYSKKLLDSVLEIPRMRRQ